MSGFDIPAIRGLDSSFGLPQGPMGSPEMLQGQQGPGLDSIIESIGDDSIKGLSGGTAKPFGGVLAESLQHVRGLQLDVREKARDMVMGEDVELHDVMIAGKKSEVAFNLLLEVRNKMIDAWEKLSRSSV